MTGKRPELPMANGKALDRAAEVILAAKRPLILVGAETSRLDQHPIDQIRDFVGGTGIPFFSTQLAKGVVPEYSDLYLGTAALSEGDYVHVAVDKADLIVTIGHSMFEKPPFIMSEGGSKVIHIAHQPAIFTQAYHPHLEVIGDIGTSVAALADRLVGNLPNAGALLVLREGILAQICEGAYDESWPPTLDRLVHAVQNVTSENDIIPLDNGLYKVAFARNFRTNYPKTLLLDNSLATMFAGVSTAIVAAKLYPERRVMAVCGDGGILPTLHELGLAVRLKLNLTVVIADNACFGMIRAKQAAKGFADYGVELDNPDFVKMAEAFGMKATLVESIDALERTLKSAIEGGGVHVVVVPVDDSKYNSLLEGLRSRKVKPPRA
jgi:acetolactate synthase-1/2/3 large subunit